MIHLIKWILLVVMVLHDVRAGVFDGVDMNDPVALMERFKAQAELIKLRNQEVYVDDCPKVRSADWRKTPYFTCKMFPAQYSSWQQYCKQGDFDDYWNANCCWIISAENAFRRAPRFPYWRDRQPPC